MIANLVLSLLLAILFAHPGTSSNITTQIDLIFPRNNTVYQPSKLFPVLFGVHNFSAAWRSRPKVVWTIFKLNITAQDSATPGCCSRWHEWKERNGGMTGWRPITYNETHHLDLAMPPPPNIFLSVNATDVSDQEDSQWMLKYDFYLDTEDCWSEKNYTRRDNRGFLFFNTSSTTGVAADVSTTDSCAPSIGAIGINSFASANESCVILPERQPEPKSCLISVDKPTAGRIDSVMHQRLANKAYGIDDGCKCVRTSWPNMTILGGGDGCDPCPHKKTTNSEKKSEGSLENSFWQLGLAALVIAFMWK